MGADGFLSKSCVAMLAQSVVYQCSPAISFFFLQEAVTLAARFPPAAPRHIQIEDSVDGPISKTHAIILVRAMLQRLPVSKPKITHLHT